MSKIIHRSLRGTLPFAVSAQGVYLTDREGKQYIDGSGGAAVSCLGHGHPDVLAAMHAQIDKVAYAHTSFFTTDVAEELADTLIAKAPPGIGHVYFVSGGSEAIEAALKMARQYYVETGEPERSIFIARRQSYHGNTLGALAVGGNEWRRKQFAPILIDVGRVSPCYEYRDRRDGETPEQYSQRLGDELEGEIQRIGPRKIIAFIAEPVVGATLGAVTATPGYFKRVRQICDRYGILFIADEVMCGMGRTGSLHAVDQEGVRPDLMAIAKGLGGGYQPIGAVLASSRIVEAFRKGTGMFQHGHTYIGHATACAAALAVQKVFARDKLIEQVQSLGAYLEKRLHETFINSPYVGDLRGRGLFRGVELVADRATKKPFDPALKLHAKVKSEAMNQGLLCYPMGGTIDGVTGDHVLLAPPFICTEAQIDEIVDKLARAIETGTHALKHAA
ncbi:putative aminotransferase [Usitatibacter rugosus]|uniref:Diaminobutyrate--2-oxoglutarate transaminase n=1 Tax=Usitatibacter rugosus TaxID=2732067 RepID=A0A6M4GTP0_9PROT|nr:aspartate aminotransferase family protein [Usitatibacter rugosus]QJR10709.1 putative aminotransferase [Usitatibacter rugosus]